MRRPSASRALLLLLACTAGASSHLLAAWEFARSTLDWGGGGAAASDAHGADVWWRGGALVLRGVQQQGAPPPWVDSPGLALPVGDDAVVVLRVRHLSACRGGAIVVLNGSSSRGGATTPRSPELRSHAWGFAPRSWTAAFPVRADGRWRVYAVPVLPPPRALLPAATETVGRLRLLPCADGAGGAPVSVELDWLRVARAPTIHAVTGCGRTLGVAPSPPVRRRARARARRSPVVRRVLTLEQWFASPSGAVDPARALAAPPAAARVFAATYSCSLRGGDVIRVVGTAFGGGGGGGGVVPLVTVGGRACTNVTWVEPGSAVTCVTPDGGSGGGGGCSGKGSPVLVAVHNGALPLLADAKPLLTYAAPPMAPTAPPLVSNVHARSLTVTWHPVPDTWQAMATTGYVVVWRRAAWDNCTRDAACVLTTATPAAAAAAAAAGGGSAHDADGGSGDAAWELLPPASAAEGAWVSASPVVTWEPWPDVQRWLLEHGADPLAELRAGRRGAAQRAPSQPAGWVVTGNVTATSLWGLQPDTRYQVRVAALVEDTLVSDHWHSALDALGQRQAVPGALVGAWSGPSVDVVTLPADILFARFDANATLPHGSAHAAATSTSPGFAGGEGAYGLLLVGDASVQNCNASHGCSDGYGGVGFADAVTSRDRRGGRGRGWLAHDAPALARRTAVDASGDDRGGGDGWADVGAAPATIAAVWGSASLRELRARVAQLRSWHSPHQHESPWFGYDDASNLAVVPSAALLTARAAWLADRDAAGMAALPRVRAFAFNESARDFVDVTGWSDAALTSALPPHAAAVGRGDPAATDAAATAGGPRADPRVVHLELVHATTAAGTNYSYWRRWAREQTPPDAVFDDRGRRVVGVDDAATGDVAAASGDAVMCDAVPRVAAAPLSAQPWRPATMAVEEAAAAEEGWDSWGEGGGEPPESDDAAGDWHQGWDAAPPQPPAGGAATAVAAARGVGGGRASVHATAPCGPALRLTGSHPRAAGAAWYARPQAVLGGFDSTFVVRLANPSRGCRTMDGVHARCVSRGGAGLAFVVQNWHPHALGEGGADGLGYGGLPLSVAVELDTAADGDAQADPHDNHVSVHVAPPWGAAAACSAAAGGAAPAWRGNSAHHARSSLGHARFAGIPDLAGGAVAVRVVFQPAFDPDLVAHPAFVAASAPAAAFLGAPPSPSCGGGGGGGGAGADGWAGRAGTGTLSVFVGDLTEPRLIVPLNLAAALQLADTHGRAWVGFTASTGAEAWQTHDVLAWELTQDHPAV